MTKYRFSILLHFTRSFQHCFIPSIESVSVLSLCLSDSHCTDDIMSVSVYLRVCVFSFVTSSHANIGPFFSMSRFIIVPLKKSVAVFCRTRSTKLLYICQSHKYKQRLCLCVCLRVYVPSALLYLHEIKFNNRR